MLLNLLYCLILILSALGFFAIPEASPNGRYFRVVAYVALFVIIGLRVFSTSLK